MNRQETAAIMGVLKAAYPDYYRGMSKDDAVAIVNLWSTMFADDDFRMVQAAVQHYIATDAKQYRPPHIGAIKESLSRMQSKEQMTEMEAWGYVAKAIRNSLYHSTEEFEKLPPVVKRVVGSPSQLRAWAMVDTDSVETVVQSNFMRSFQSRAKEQKDFEKLPSSIQQILGQLSGGMELPALPDGENWGENGW